MISDWIVVKWFLLIIVIGHDNPLIRTIMRWSRTSSSPIWPWMKWHKVLETVVTSHESLNEPTRWESQAITMTPTCKAKQRKSKTMWYDWRFCISAYLLLRFVEDISYGHESHIGYHSRLLHAAITDLRSSSFFSLSFCGVSNELHTSTNINCIINVYRIIVFIYIFNIH